ncbi:CD99 antigen [Camarhynchus parvulus]|uniref:CD99 antigen n=1 Tax=Geospiza parvula TaxID=87175 RepID=UPI0012380736|nr:CD99 antigen [Camarhynchus parvulus]
MVAIHIAADVPQNHVEDQQDGEDEQSHQDSLGHRRDEGLHVTRGPPPRTDDSRTTRGQRARTDPAAPPPPPPPPPATRRAPAAGAEPVAECRGLPRSAPPLRRSGGRGGSRAGGTGRRARTARRGGAPGHGLRGPAAASSPPCGGGGVRPGAGKLRRGGGPWGTGVKRPVALQVSDESHPRRRESCGRDAAGAAAPGPRGSVRGQREPRAARAARPRQPGTAPAGVFRPAERKPSIRHQPPAPEAIPPPSWKEGPGARLPERAGAVARPRGGAALAATGTAAAVLGEAVGSAWCVCVCELVGRAAMWRWRLLLLPVLLAVLFSVRGQDEFSLEDALLGESTKKPLVTQKTPSSNKDDLDFSDAFDFGDPKPHPPANPRDTDNPKKDQPKDSDKFDDSDLLDGGFPRGGGGDGSGSNERKGPTPNSDQEGEGSQGVLAGIISAVGATVVASVGSFIAYQKKKLCFKQSDEENVNMDSHRGAQSEPPVQRTLLEN